MNQHAHNGAMKFSGFVLVMTLKICKSMLFNLLAFVTGLSFGYITTMQHVRHYAKTNSNFGYLQQLDDVCSEIQELDKTYTKKLVEMRQTVDYFKMKLSYDANPEYRMGSGVKNADQPR